MVIATSHKDGDICLLAETPRDFLGVRLPTRTAPDESWRERERVDMCVTALRSQIHTHRAILKSHMRVSWSGDNLQA